MLLSTIFMVLAQLFVKCFKDYLGSTWKCQAIPIDSNKNRQKAS